MVSLQSMDASLNSFSFSLQTSSGDNISLSMYDNQEVDLSASEDKSSKSFSMSLRHEMGYSFSYSGNGIDAQDLKEIKKAMKAIKPIFQKFLKNIKDNNLIPNDKEMVNWTNIAKKELPKIADENKLNMLKDKTVSTMDDILSIFKRDENMIKGAKKFFDKLFDRSKFEYYV